MKEMFSDISSWMHCFTFFPFPSVVVPLISVHSFWNPSLWSHQCQTALLETWRVLLCFGKLTSSDSLNLQIIWSLERTSDESNTDIIKELIEAEQRKTWPDMNLQSSLATCSRTVSPSSFDICFCTSNSFIQIIYDRDPLFSILIGKKIVD